jgi:DHA1 family bicyclomycin/chloramphenicol resistance-like MFS transporter
MLARSFENLHMAASSLSKPALSQLSLALLLGALAMFGPFAIDSIFPAFGQIEREFAVSAAAMQQTIAVYMLAYGTASVLHGPMSDAYGRRVVLLVGIAVFVLASVGCALSSSLPQLLFFRAVQGVSSGVGIIVGRAIVRDLREGPDAQRLMSQISMIFTIAPAVAPIIGGWILGWADWPMIFWFLVVFSALLWLVVALILPESHPIDARVPVSLRSLWRGSTGMLRNRSFLLLSLTATFNFSALFLYISSAPAFVMGLLHMNEQQFGWFFAPTIGGMAMGAFLSGRTAGKVAPQRMVRIGFSVCLLATVSSLVYALSVDAVVYPWAVLPLMFNSMGIAIVFPIVTLAVIDLYPRQRGAASSMQTFISLMINAGIAGVLSPLVSHSAVWMALAAVGCCAIAITFWVLFNRHGHAPLHNPAAAEVAGLEPLDRL